MEQSNETINNSVNTEEGKEEQTDTMGILDKFCWPGFLMPQFWGICNGMPVGMIAFIPIFAPKSISGTLILYRSRNLKSVKTEISGTYKMDTAIRSYRRG